jgi:hypothetical protein
MKQSRWLPVLCATFSLLGVRMACAQTVVPGSTAFCLYEIPVEEAGKRRWINLGIVQYVETTSTELKIFYGGGSFGSGHEVKIPFSSKEEAATIMEKLRRVAAACR